MYVHIKPDKQSALNTSPQSVHGLFCSEYNVKRLTGEGVLARIMAQYFKPLTALQSVSHSVIPFLFI